MQDWIATTLSVSAGGVLTMFSGWLADQRLTKRERERRREERKDTLIFKQNEFQRETLLALQIACQKLVRNTGAAFHQDDMASRQSKDWGKQQLPEELSDGHGTFNTDVMLLSSRIQDDEIRELAETLRRQATSVLMSNDKKAAERELMQIATTQDALITRAGQLLRSLDKLEAS